MELVGKVFGPGPQGELIVHADRPWKYGEGVKVMDRKGRLLGRVEGVVGPAAAPYLVVRTTETGEGKGLGQKLKGTEVYMEPASASGDQPVGRARRQGRPTGHEKRRP